MNSDVKLQSKPETVLPFLLSHVEEVFAQPQQVGIIAGFEYDPEPAVPFLWVTVQGIRLFLKM